MALVDGMGKGIRIDAPACVPSRYGLLSVAEVEDVPDGHWLAGVHTELESCEDLQVWDIKCDKGDRTKGTDDGLSFPESDPFTLIAPFDCSTGGISLGDAWDHAENRLSQGEARSVERTFWTGRDGLDNRIRGTLGGALAVPDDNDDSTDEVVDLTPVSGAVTITDGLALLESWAGENMSCAPVVHAARGITTYLAERTLISPTGNIMYADGTGSRVAVGGGYLTSGPDNVAPAAGEAWMWVTGSIKILRGPVFFTPERDDLAAAINRVVNDITVFAERNYVALRSCGLAAIRVSLRSCCC